ncbi:MAG: tyrosine decarboxylase MfnA [Candidatus Asgardarchaeia archaeon]
MIHKEERIQDILKEIRAILSRDITFSSGHVIGSMCTMPHEVAKKIFIEYIDRNAGDLGISLGTAEIEKKVINWIAKQVGGSDQVVGNIVSGGSEANLLGLYAARKHKKVRGKAKIIASEAVHVSIEKAADILNMDLVKVPVNKENYNVDATSFEKHIDKNTVGIVGVAGTTGLGIIEPIKDLSELAEKYDLHLHVDAAFGGYVIPFLKRLGYNVPEFGFALSNVLSMTVDPHKMGMAPIPAGGTLFRSEEVKKRIEFTIYYLSGGSVKSATITGTRPGAPIIATWALIKYLGVDGYTRIVKNAMELTEWFSKEIEAMKGVELVIKPVMNIVGIRPTNKALDFVEKELRKRGWAISRFPEFLRVVIMPHVKKEHLEQFLLDLEEIVR